jgi:hypothetical protein
VEASPPRLVPLPERGEFEAYDTNTLPYYAGAVTYHMIFSLDRVPDADTIVLELSTDRPFHEASEVSVNGSPFQAVLWQPRCVELPASCVRQGSNDVTVRVYTTLARAFEGQWFDYRAQTAHHLAAPFCAGHGARLSRNAASLILEREP